MKHELKKEATIDQPAAAVFDWITDWSNVRTWLGDDVVAITFLSAHSDADPMQAGMRFKETRKMGKMKASAKIDVLEHGVNETGYRHRALFSDGCNRFMNEYTLTPDGAGCHATWRMWSEPKSMFQKACDKLFGKKMVQMTEKCMGDHLEDLKRLVETG